MSRRRDPTNIVRRHNDLYGGDGSGSDGEAGEGEGEGEPGHAEAARFASLVDQLSEKRREGRVAALDGLTELIRRAPEAALVAQWEDELVRAVRGAVGSEDRGEACAGLRLLPHLATLAPTASLRLPLGTQFLPSLFRLAEQAPEAEVRAAAALAAASLVFLLDADEAHTMAALAALAARLADEQHAPALEALLLSWALLVSSCGRDYVLDEIVPRDAERLGALLAHPSLAVRVAAGEALALLAQDARLAQDDADEPYTPFYFSGYFDVQEALELLSSDAAPGTGLRLSKVDREKQRVGFGPLRAALEQGVAPEEELTVAGRRYALGTWRALVQLAWARATLGGGLLPHLQHNPTIAAVFGIQARGTAEDEADADKPSSAHLRRRQQARDRSRRDKRAQGSVHDH